jgi:hypothetical protein
MFRELEARPGHIRILLDRTLENGCRLPRTACRAVLSLIVNFWVAVLVDGVPRGPSLCIRSSGNTSVDVVGRSKKMLGLTRAFRQK